jgi:phosphoglycerate dehydrogenase-like enzyme
VLRIAVLDDFQSVSGEFADWSRLPEEAEVVAFADHLDDEDAVADRLTDFDVVVAMRERTPFPRSLLARLPRLRLLVTTGARNAAIDVAAAAERGVTVCGTGAHPTGTAELTWALVLAVARHIPEEDAGMRAGGWQRTVGTDLAGARLGVVGLGRLGTRVARIGQAFGMDVVAWSQNLTDERATEAGVRRVERDELFATADVVTVHLVLSERTRGLVGRDELARMKRSAILVNTSRGPVVDEAALIAAVRSRAAAGRPSAAQAAPCRAHPAHRIRHPRQLGGLPRRGGRRGARLARRRPDPRADLTGADAGAVNTSRRFRPSRRPGRARPGLSADAPYDA